MPHPLRSGLLCLLLLLTIGAPATHAEDSHLTVGERHVDRGEYEQALDAFGKGAQAGDGACLDWLGFMHLEGMGVIESPRLALGMFHTAAKLGNDQACRNLGNMYFGGRGVVPDVKAARDWWLKAVQRGTDPRPAFSLGQLYRIGEVVGRDDTQARTYFELAKERGSDDALVALAVMNAKENVLTAEDERTLTELAQRGHDVAEGTLAFYRMRNSGKVLLVTSAPFVHQAHNFCGVCSTTMLLRSQGVDVTQYDVARKRDPIRWGEGSHWDELVGVVRQVDQTWKVESFDHTDAGFKQATMAAVSELRAGRPLVIDILREAEWTSAHSILLIGYDPTTNEFLTQNSALPYPGYERFSQSELKEVWRSRGFLSTNRELRRPIMRVVE